MNEHYNVKFGEIWPMLKDNDMETEELDLTVRVYNFLKRGGIHTLQQLLERSYNDLVEITCSEKYCQGIISYIIDMLNSLSDVQSFALAASIWRSDKTLTDKHAAYQDIIMNHPDCSFPADVKHYPSGGLHIYLRELIAWEEKTMIEFRTVDNDSEYVLYEEMKNPYDRVMVSKYTTYEEAQRAVCQCSWENPKMFCAAIARTSGCSGKSWKHLFSATFNHFGEVMDIDAVHFDDDGNLSYNCSYRMQKES